MADYTTINKSTLYQNQLIWDGTGATNARTGLGFQPDLAWGKERSSTSGSIIQDSVQGLSVYLASNSDSGTNPTSVQFTSFDSDGFTLGTSTGINQSGQTNVGWAWKADNTSGSSNTDGSITSTVAVNSTSKFSIVKWSGSGATATIGHGLGVVPQCIIVKSLSGSGSWIVYHESMGATKNLILDASNAAATVSTMWNDTSPTSSVFTVGSNSATNGSGVDLIAYCWADVQGFQKMSRYIGNGSTNGTFVYTGFKPTLVIVKKSSDSDGWWQMEDNTRDPYNPASHALFANVVDAEYTGSNYYVDYLSNGFKIRSTNAGIGTSGGDYIYLAWGQTLVGTNNIVATAR
tara:strand:- start:722 stop:1762 length:1041 start_codon:yes stop_codon:yes gene_type:complete